VQIMSLSVASNLSRDFTQGSEMFSRFEAFSTVPVKVFFLACDTMWPCRLVPHSDSR